VPEAHFLVSVGIPTYNRPEGLQKTLECICKQTYNNIEIIVSDNCSTNPEVQKVINDFANIDSRIINVRQKENIGIFQNFKFVLQKAKGDYFMWAADDDEWAPDFIEHLVSIIGNHSAAFCNYSVKILSTGEIEQKQIYQSASGNTKYKQAVSFLKERTPSMFYGIYKTSDIFWLKDFNEIFDWLDCFVIFKIILLHNGYTISKKHLYTAGIKSAEYEYKPMSKNKKKIFTYMPYIKNCIGVILKSDISLPQKMKICCYLIDVNLMAFMQLEKMRKCYPVYTKLYRIYRFFIPKTEVYKLY
jgi:glycosyltransferase involved in cell wall biosynthesis